MVVYNLYQKQECDPGEVLRKILYVDVPAGLQNFDFRYTKFCPLLPSINIPILNKKHPILLKLDAFYHHLLKTHPISVNRMPSSVMKNPPIIVPKSTKKHPKR